MRLGAKLVREQLHEETGKGQGSGKVKVKKLIIWRKAGHGILSWRVKDLVPGQRWVIFWTMQSSWVASIVFPVVVCGAVWLEAGQLCAGIPVPLVSNGLGMSFLGGTACPRSLLSSDYLTFLFSAWLGSKGSSCLWETVPCFCREVQGKMIIKDKTSPRTLDN